MLNLSTKNDCYFTIIGILFILNLIVVPPADSTEKVIGSVVDSYNNVPVYYHGKNILKSHGKHSFEDGYYFGQKWQCTEFVKRFYYQSKKHKMPNVWGHAKDYFDPRFKDGKLNLDRGMIQFSNDGKIKPKSDDLIVFQDTKYGHVAIITKVEGEFVEIIQQNVYKNTRQKLSLSYKNGQYYIKGERTPVGWLRTLK